MCGTPPFFAHIFHTDLLKGRMGFLPVWNTGPTFLPSTFIECPAPALNQTWQTQWENG